MVGHSGFEPFADDASAMEIDGLKFENGTASVAMYGSVSFTRDLTGRERLARVLAVLGAVEKVLAAPDLPERIADDEEASTVRNPFA
jgi:hypothetical protein